MTPRQVSEEERSVAYSRRRENSADYDVSDFEKVKSLSRGREENKAFPTWSLICGPLYRTELKSVPIQSGLCHSSHIKSANPQGSRCLSRERNLGSW